MSKYSHIRTMEELENAIGSARIDTRVQLARLKDQASQVSSIYSPKALLTEGVHRATNSISLSGIALSVIDFLRDRLRKK